MVTAKGKRRARRAAQSERAGAPTMASRWTTPFGMIALIVTLGLAAAIAHAAWQDRAEDTRRLTAWAEAVHARLTHELEQLHATLRAWGDDETLRDALIAADGRAIRRIEEGLRRAMPTALAIHVRTREAALSPTGEDPDLSFAGRDLVRQAVETGELTMLEAHRVAQAQRHLAIAGPVRSEDSGEVSGVVYLALPATMLPETGGAIRGLGQIHYQQRIGETFVAIDPPSTPAAPQGPPAQVTPVAGTRLAVAAWRESGAGLGPARLGAMLGIYLAVLALTALVLAWSHRRLDRALSADIVEILAVMEDHIERRTSREVQWQFRPMQLLSEQMLLLLHRTIGVPANLAQTATEPAEIEVAGKEREPRRGTELRKPDEDNEDLAAEIDALLARHPRQTDAAGTPTSRGAADPPANVFRGPHMRGRHDTELNEALAREIGLALGSEMAAEGQRTVYVGQDTASASQTLSTALADGLCACGCDVIELGVAPAPLVYFAACHEGEHAGVVITVDCHEPEQSEIRVLLQGEFLAAERLDALRERILHQDFVAGSGARRAGDVTDTYLTRIDQDVALARVLKVVLDCAGGAAARIVPALYRRLGCQVIELDGADAGESPASRPADPAQPADLQALAKRVVHEKADLGLVFDCDGDRLGIIGSDGGFVAADRVLMLLAVDILSRHLGADVICDAACTRRLPVEVRQHGGRVLLWRSEPAALLAKLRETGAAIAASLSGHFVVAERWLGLDDAIYASARVLELLALDPRPSAEALAPLAGGLTTPELYVSVAEGEDLRLLDKVTDLARQHTEAQLSTVDGLRAELESGWGLMRPAATHAGLVFRFEADTEAAMAMVQDLFRGWVARVAPGLELPF